jgi:hypothetical protein
VENKTKVYIAVGAILVVLASLWMFSRRSSPTNSDVDNTVQAITDTNIAIGNEVANGITAVDRATEASDRASTAITDSANSNAIIQTGITNSQNIITECIGINQQTKQLLSDIEQANTKGKTGTTP